MTDEITACDPIGAKEESFIQSIMAEYNAACRKHPKFCDELLDNSVNYAKQESFIKNYQEKNAEKSWATDILDEEIAEAMNAYQQGDKAHAMQELAQCGAVILRMMEQVEKEMQ